MPAPRVLVITPKLHERFWAKVNFNGPIAPNMNDPCWIWIAATERRGYGQFQVKLEDGRFVSELAHRVAWAITHGALSQKNTCHDCDVRNCVRPSHLWEGTDAENLADRDAKGRQASGDRNGSILHPESRPRGSAHYETHLTEEIVRSIRVRVAAGGNQSAIGRELGIDQSSVNCIVKRRTWKHVL
jgi:hypothetical protein